MISTAFSRISIGVAALTGLLAFCAVGQARDYLKGERPQQRGYSEAVITEGGKTVWLAGQTATVDDAGKSLASDFDGQVRQLFKNLDRTLQKAGGKLSDMVQMTIVDPKHSLGDDERKLTSQEIARRIEREAEGVEGITLFLQPVQDLTTDTTVSATQYQFVLENANISELNAWVPKLVSRLQNVPELTDLATDLQQSGLSADIVIDRKTAGRFGVTPATVDNALYDAFGQRIASTIFTQSNQYRVILEAAPSLQRSLDSIGSIYVPSSAGSTSSASGAGQVPLSAIMTVSVKETPLRIGHLGQFPAATISFNLAPGASLGEAVREIRAVQQEMKLPASFIANFRGASSAFESSLTNEVLLLVAAIVTMYIILGVLYESFIHPITILSTLPSAGVGALLALMLAGCGLDVMGIIGILLLIGIVKKNAIMMVDFALEAERDDGKSPREAIYQACLLRFRPILMTTMAALLGALPLMLGTGTGSELRRPLGIAIVGGLILSQILTLFTTPVIYLALDRLGRRFFPRAVNGPLE